MISHLSPKASVLVLLSCIGLHISSCTDKKSRDEIATEIRVLDITRGDIALCGSGIDEFGTVGFKASCDANVSSDFNLAMALLHSFEYTESEKVFARVIDGDPRCVMAYWGVAMCNFHPLWAPPTSSDLEKGSKIITVARSIITDRSSRESDYVEAIATMYDQWNTLDHRVRLLKFEEASAAMFQKYPEDKETAIFYALALNAAADPADKTYTKQKKAGAILNKLFADQPNHPGIAHYLIHNYDYPELAELALPAARRYASIAAASAHAQHMPSHIFTRLGLWEESIQSNQKSVAAAQCYAENTGMKGHWDEELHGLDYLIYAYLQKANDDKALAQMSYLKTIKEVFPVNFKDAYSFASMPARYALERKDWQAAAKLQLEPPDFPWNKFLWEKANINFARLLGALHSGQTANAKNEFEELQIIHETLAKEKENYKANLVLIQLKASEAWIRLNQGQQAQAIRLMTEAADMEDATAKHPVTPGEIIPARELLGDLFFKIHDFDNALEAYEAALKTHPNRFNGLYGAAQASEKSGDDDKARHYYKQLLALADSSGTSRPQLGVARSYVQSHSHK